jgi:hypothetical protein
MTNKRLIITFLLFLATLYSYGQSPFYFTGYGRALVGKSKFDEKSEFVKNDTSSKKQALDGNFVFDLGANIKPNEQFKASAILRFSNAFGGFYGSGSLMEFRQIQIQGVLANKVLYNIGDIDLSMTRYTLFNSTPSTTSEFEGEAFKIRRGIVDYENFNYGNKWRLQGIQAGTNIGFNKIIQNINVSAFGTRTIPSNFLNTPDRLLYGGAVKVKQSKFLEVGGNAISMTDIAGTVQDTVVFYKNSVITGDYKISVSTRTVNFATYGEVGRSFYDLNVISGNTRVKKTDGFFDVGASANHRYIPFSAAVSYRLVGPDFSSPGAQTLRTLDNQGGVLLPSGGTDGLTGPSGVIQRNQNIFDRMTDLNLYNRSISTTLMYFNPIYNNSNPYGAATPNRKGITVDLKYGNKDSLIYVNINSQILSEVLGTGIKDKRKFVLINPGATFNINRLLGINRLLALSGAVRYEKTTGSKGANIDLTSTMIDGSLTVETLKGLDLIGGIKYLAAKGNEYLFIRDQFNTIYDYQQISPNVAQTVYSGGFRYRFTNYIFFAANAFIFSNTDNATSLNNYKVNQYYFSYIMRF